MNSAAVMGAEPGQRVWQRSGALTGSAWVLVDDRPEPPGGTRRTSHRSTRRRGVAGRRRQQGADPGLRWLIRWYRARWAARRALRRR